jgi:hypothetical protein
VAGLEELPLWLDQPPHVLPSRDSTGSRRPREGACRGWEPIVQILDSYSRAASAGRRLSRTIRTSSSGICCLWRSVSPCL